MADAPQIPGTHVDLGHAMITMVEPTRDAARLREYNRWYEHDHAYSGVMIGPWAFAHRRWVATRALKDLRVPHASTVATPVDRGSFIAFYWYLKDHVDDHFTWAFPQTKWLTDQGRMNGDRMHVSTSLYDFAGAVNRPAWPVPAEIALDHPYAGLVVTWLERADDAVNDDVVAWALRDWAPTRLTADSPVAQALVFTPRDFPGIPGSGVGVGTRVCVAWLLQRDPRDVWATHGAELVDDVATARVATLGLAAPFVPVVAGTETYLDELW